MRKYSPVLLALLGIGTCLAVQPSAPVAATPAAVAPAPVVAPPAAAPAAAVAQPMAPAVAPAVLPVPEAVAPAPAVPAFADTDGLSRKVLGLALEAVEAARAGGISGRDNLLTVIDYSLPSTEPRLWVLDLGRGKVLFHELVAHGRGTGENYATRFSNTPDSRQTSLGLFLTGGTYHGGNGYSLRLSGLDAGLNDRAEARAIVMHGAWYVSPEQARSQGRLGRSWGCPALSEAMAPKVIDTIKGGSFLFSYHPDEPRLAGRLAPAGGDAPAAVRAAR